MSEDIWNEMVEKYDIHGYDNSCVIINYETLIELTEKAEKWDMLVPLLKEGDEEEAIEVYMARAKTAFLTDTLGKCLLRKERLEAVKKLVEKGPSLNVDTLEDCQQAVDDWLGKLMNVLEAEE